MTTSTSSTCVVKIAPCLREVNDTDVCLDKKQFDLTCTHGVVLLNEDQSRLQLIVNRLNKNVTIRDVLFTFKV